MQGIPHSIQQLLQDRHIRPPRIVRVVPDEHVSAKHIGATLLGENPLVIADTQSLEAAKPYVDDAYVNDYATLIFPAPAKPELTGCVEQAIAKISEVAATSIVVIGSGSLSDIGKYVAAKCGLPLAIIATAPSMNGYASQNASLISNGLKQSFQAKMADCLVLSRDLLSAAPEHMKRAGLADALSSVSADIDWRLSHLLMGTVYYPEIFEAQQPYVERAAADDTALMELLIIQGLAMSAAGSSAPASGGEHMLAHLLEMLKPDFCINRLHGELIAITHPIYLKCQIQLLNSPGPLTLRAIPNEGELTNIFGDHAQSLLVNMEEKQKILNDRGAQIKRELTSEWNDVRFELASRTRLLTKSVSQMTVLSAADMEMQKLVKTLLPYAFISRDRLTMLDLQPD